MHTHRTETANVAASRAKPGYFSRIRAFWQRRQTLSALEQLEYHIQKDIGFRR